MSVSIKNVIKYQSTIGDLLIQYGFNSPIFLKGFTQEEKHNRNLYVEDDKAGSRLERRFALREALESLLGCKVVVSVSNQMAPFFRKKLDAPSASVKTTVAALQSHNNDLQKQMLTYFGENWELNDAGETHQRGCSSESQSLFWAKNDSAATNKAKNNDEMASTSIQRKEWYREEFSTHSRQKAVLQQS